MKAVLVIAVFWAVVAHAAPDARDACISDRDIDHTEIVNDTTMLFHMRDHRVWKNTLPVRCFGLKNEPGGFSYMPTVSGTEDLCSNQVTIRLNTMRSICQLGNFTPVTRP